MGVGGGWELSQGHEESVMWTAEIGSWFVLRTQQVNSTLSLVPDAV